ncbi:hypothetical protein SK128_003557 [Halocaridina rubra]|uniref:Biogenesis of lysosome-related organelles complex 1 subunit 3 n=1 Tax=Halocaridina rubra TaxID=373956 RepID=A0AAN9A4Y3_HALRR
MSGIQGIIVCGEASESDEEEEFCAATALGHKTSDTRIASRPVYEPRYDVAEKQAIHSLHQHQLQQRKASTSLLHQKLYETNKSLTKNLAKAFQEPLVTKASQLSAITSSLPSTHNSTFAAHAAFSQVTSNLSRIDLMLQGLNHINALDTLKSPCV